MNICNYKAFLASLAFITVTSITAQAAVYSVDAFLNSSSGGTPVASVALSGGQFFSVSAAATDLWSAGALPRWSNAAGLIANTFATGTDESGESSGTLIGKNFGTHNQFSFSAPYGALVGEIGGTYIELGTNYTGAAPLGGGTLNLYYWDSNNGDNSGKIDVTIDTRTANVPDGGSNVMLLGAGMLGTVMVRRAIKRPKVA